MDMDHDAGQGVRRRRGTTVLAMAMALAWGVPAGADATDVPDRFAIELGGFNVDAETILRLSSARLGGTTVNFEKDFDLPSKANRGSLDVYWRVGRRHLLNVSLSRLHRDGEGQSLDRDIAWRDFVFPAGATVRGKVNSDYVSGAYRFAAFRNDRFEIGPALGFGFLKITAGLAGNATVGGQNRSVTLPVDLDASTSSPTADLGGYLRWWPARRVLVRADGRYIFVKPERAEASVTEARAGLQWYPWQKVGVGAQYIYTKFRYDREILSTALSGSYRNRGGQLYVSFAF